MSGPQLSFAAALSGGALLLLIGVLGSGSFATTGPDMALAKKPPLCTPVKHMGRKTYLVDQAWQFYRRLERSSPLRVGWCGCAKRCERIDRNAARIEASAFRANEARVNPSVPPEQREEYAKRAIELFGERNETVNLFRDCLDETRPPISKDISSPMEPLKGCVRELSLPVEWARWCAEFEAKWGKVYSDFVNEFKNKSQSTHSLDFYILATPDGKLKQSGKWVADGMTKKKAQSYINRIAGIEMRAFPSKSKKQYHQWRTTLIVQNGAPSKGRFLSEPMDCPQEEDPD